MLPLETMCIFLASNLYGCVLETLLLLYTAIVYSHIFPCLKCLDDVGENNILFIQDNQL